MTNPRATASFRDNPPPFTPAGGAADPSTTLEQDDIPTANLADRLPPDASDKFIGLRNQEGDALAARQALSERRNDHIAEHGRLLRALTHMRNEQTPEGTLPLVNAQRALDENEAEMVRINQRYNAPVLNIVTNLTRWIQQAKGPIEPYEGEVSTKGTVAEARARVAFLLSQIADVRRAPLSGAERRAKVRQEVASLAERARPTVDGAGHIVWPTVRQSIGMLGAIAPGHTHKPGLDSEVISDSVHVVGAIGFEAIDQRAIACRYFPEQVLEDLLSDIADDGLTDAQRSGKIAKLEADILTTERTEVSLCDRDGITYRPDTDARAVLGLAD
jgi:hypothetical protein